MLPNCSSFQQYLGIHVYQLPRYQPSYREMNRPLALRRIHSSLPPTQVPLVIIIIETAQLHPSGRFAQRGYREACFPPPLSPALALTSHVFLVAPFGHLHLHDAHPSPWRRKLRGGPSALGSSSSREPVLRLGTHGKVRWSPVKSRSSQ